MRTEGKHQAGQTFPGGRDCCNAPMRGTESMPVLPLTAAPPRLPQAARLRSLSASGRPRTTRRRPCMLSRKRRAPQGASKTDDAQHMPEWMGMLAACMRTHVHGRRRGRRRWCPMRVCSARNKPAQASPPDTCPRLTVPLLHCRCARRWRPARSASSTLTSLSGEHGPLAAGGTRLLAPQCVADIQHPQRPHSHPQAQPRARRGGAEQEAPHARRGHGDHGRGQARHGLHPAALGGVGPRECWQARKRALPRRPGRPGPRPRGLGCNSSGLLCRM